MEITNIRFIKHEGGYSARVAFKDNEDKLHKRIFPRAGSEVEAFRLATPAIIKALSDQSIPEGAYQEDQILIAQDISC